MSELNISPNALEAMREAGWQYRPNRQWFELDYYQCDNRYEIASDLSDYTGYSVQCYDTSVGKGYWYVSLRTDDECLDFAKKYNEYDNAQQRISDALFNHTLLLSKEQYGQIAEMVKRYNKRVVGDQVMIAIPEDEFTKRIIAILDALGM